MSKYVLKDGTKLIDYCKEKGISYNTIVARIRKLNLTPEEALEWVRDVPCKVDALASARKYQRLQHGYSETESRLSKADFRNMVSNAKSLIVFDGCSLGNFCRQYGLKYNSVWRYVKRHKVTSLKELKAFYAGVPYGEEDELS